MRVEQAYADFLKGYFSTHERRSKTKAAYKLDISQFISFAGPDSDICSLDGTLVERWAAALQVKNYSPASIRRKMVALRVFSSYWLRKGVLSESPFWRVKLSYGHIEQLPRSLTEQEMRALLMRAWRNCVALEPRLFDREKVSESRSPMCYRVLRNLAIVDLLFATGMRVGEASALDVRDFFIREAIFRVQGKGGRDRLAVIVDNATVQIQRTHIEARSKMKTTSDALFVNVNGNRLSTQGITKIIAKLRREARIRRHVTPHMLRHTVATLLLQNGADIRIVQEFLGHKSITTTQRYTHITKDHMTRVLRKRHPSIKLNAKLVKLTT